MGYFGPSGFTTQLVPRQATFAPLPSKILVLLQGVSSTATGQTFLEAALAIASIVEPFIYEDSAGFRRWRGLGPVEGRRLLDLLPQDLRDDHHQRAPSLAEEVDVIERHGGSLSGYWVLPPRDDERISLDGMIVPVGAVDEADPDEAVEGKETDGAMVGLWWD